MSRLALLLVCLALLPAPLAAQALDSTRVHELAVQIAKDISQFEMRSALNQYGRSLPAMGNFFGIELEIPPAGGRESDLLGVTWVHYGLEAMLAEAVRLDEDGGHVSWTAHTFERIAGQGPRIALEMARERDLLDSAFHPIVVGVRMARIDIDEVLDWLERAELAPDEQLRFHAVALGFRGYDHPHSTWKRADTLPEPYRTEVRLQALSAVTARDPIPAAVLEAELSRVVEVVRTLDEESAHQALVTVATTCARRAIGACAQLDLPESDSERSVADDIFILARGGLFHQATRRLDRLRSTEPPLVTARVMAQALSSIGLHCRPPYCDLVSADSLAAEWLEEILAAEADALAGRIDRTAVRFGRDDLTELQRALGAYLGRRDLDALRDLLRRMDDAEAIAAAVRPLLSPPPAFDLTRAAETYIEFAPEDAVLFTVPYLELQRAGRPDLAEAILGRASPGAATNALIYWVYALTYSGRVTEARGVMEDIIRTAPYGSLGVGNARHLLHSLQSLRMLDQYLDHVLALPTPRERVNGLYPVVRAWLQTATVEG